MGPRTYIANDGVHVQYRLRFTALQGFVLRLLAQFILFGGAKGGGKTVLLCRWALKKCIDFPGNKVWIGRRRAVDFNNTTLQTWRRVIPPQLYRIVKQEKRIYVPCTRGVTSEIDYGGLDDQETIEKFNSAEYGNVGGDQWEETERTDFAMLRGTLRHILPDGNKPDYQCLFTANPKENYIKQLFIQNPVQGDAATGCGRFQFVRALPSDNEYLREGYVEELRQAFKFRPQLLAAYLEGSWDNLASADTVIWPSWVDTARILIPDDTTQKRVVVCDPAREGDDECVIYVLERTAKGFYRKIHEEIEQYTPNIIRTAKRLVKLCRDFRADVIVVDAVGLGEGIGDYIAENHHTDFQRDRITLLRFRGGSTEGFTDQDKKHYANLKTKAWMEAAKLFYQARVVLPDDDVLCGQLTWQKVEVVSDVQQRVVEKSKLKEEYGDSPDRADAWIMGLYGFRYADEIKAPVKSTRGSEIWDAVKRDLKQRSEQGDGADETVDFEKDMVPV